MTDQNTELIDTRGEFNPPACPVDEPSEPVSAIDNLLHVAISSNLDVEKLDKLLALKREYEAEEARKSYRAALARFQRLCPIVPCDRRGGGNAPWKYASLSKIDEISLPVLGRCDIARSFNCNQETKLVTCTLTHKDGHEESSTFPWSVEGQKGGLEKMTDQQRYGAALRYAMRQSYKQVSGVPVADEDVDATRPSPPPTDTEITQFKRKWWDWQKSIGAMSDDTPEAERKQAFTRFAGSLATASDLTEAWSRLATALQTKGSDDVSSQSESGRKDHDRREHHAGRDADSREPDQPGD